MADLQEVRVPDIGDFDQVDVIEVLVSEGDEVDVDDSLITLESDKASLEVPSPVAGVVREVAVSVGDQVSEGDVIAKVEPAEEAAPDDAEEEPESEEGSESEPEPEADEEPEAAKPRAARGREREPSKGRAEGGGAGPEVYASPSVRKRARELQVDLSAVEGTGRKGRITPEDVEEHARRAEEPAAAGLPRIPEVDFARFGEVEAQELTRIQELTGEAMHRSWVNLPHVTQFDEADVTELERFRKSRKAEAEERGVNLTPVPFVIAACVAALKKFPRFNSSLHPDGDRIVLKHYINIGVAVDTPRGLVVPVIRDADRKGILELAEAVDDVASRAREGKIAPDDIQGGTFTVSSLGGIGGTAFTPIINAPEVAILGVSRARMQPVWQGEDFEPRLILPLSLSYDHRVIDGAAAARFTRYLAEVLGDLRNLLL
ncbi:MAG: dihydrolipoyllysine-residue acetyltransferase [Acidobacteriota bacterium]